MAYKKNGRKKKFRKFSLDDRISYWNKIFKQESDRAQKTGKRTTRLEFASGFCQGAERGYSLNYDERSAARKAGEDAGVKARERAHKVKF